MEPIGGEKAKRITTGSTSKIFINSTMDVMDSCSSSDIPKIKVVKQAPIPSDTREIKVIEQVPIQVGKSIGGIFRKFKFPESWLLQFWECTHSNSKDTGYNLKLTDQFFMSTRDKELLQDYRNKCLKKCLENRYPVVGVETKVGNWLAGRAAQTGIADHRTKHYVLVQKDQHSDDVGDKGQLVLPVLYGQGAGNIKLVGIIELVTPVPKESYVDDFEQLHKLLMDEGLKSKYMGKTIKVRYNNDWLKFTLPFSANLTDLHRKVKERSEKLRQHQNFCVGYEVTEGNYLPISSDEELRVCMKEASSKGAKFIKMCVY